MSVSTASGCWVSTAAMQLVETPAVPTTSTPSTLGEQGHGALANQVVVLREHDAQHARMVHVDPPARKANRVSITVVLGEDNVLVREGVRALLDSYDDIEVVGVAEDAPSLLAAAAEHVPDVVVTDIKMPPSFQLEGIDCAHAIREQHPDTGVVVLSAPRRRGVRDRAARPGPQRPGLPA